MGIDLHIKILHITSIVVVGRWLRIASNKRLTTIRQKNQNNILVLIIITQRYIKILLIF